MSPTPFGRRNFMKNGSGSRIFNDLRTFFDPAIWAYHRFCLSFRDVEDLLAERGILVSETG